MTDIPDVCLFCLDQQYPDERPNFACPACGRVEDLAGMSNMDLIRYRKGARFSRKEYQRIMVEIEHRLLQDDSSRCLYSTVAGFRCKKPINHTDGHDVMAAQP